jgi:hypothetical protein
MIELLVERPRFHDFDFLNLRWADILAPRKILHG